MRVRKRALPIPDITRSCLKKSHCVACARSRFEVRRYAVSSERYQDRVRLRERRAVLEFEHGRLVCGVEPPVFGRASRGSSSHTSLAVSGSRRW